MHTPGVRGTLVLCRLTSQNDLGNSCALFVMQEIHYENCAALFNGTRSIGGSYLLLGTLVLEHCLLAAAYHISPQTPWLLVVLTVRRTRTFGNRGRVPAPQHIRTLIQEIACVAFDVHKRHIA